MSYPGGKACPGTFQALINEIPAHRVFVSPFLGHCAVMRYKRPAEISIGVDLDPDVIKWWAAANMPGLQLYESDGIGFLRQYFEVGRVGGAAEHGDVMVYCDPPYPKKSRRNPRRYYAFELSDEEHEELLFVLKRVRAQVAISCYRNGLYDRELADWRQVEYRARTRGGHTGFEVLYCNYGPPKVLHDASFVGRNRRERERNQRQVGRTMARLERMEDTRRQALLQSVWRDYRTVFEAWT